MLAATVLSGAAVALLVTRGFLHGPEAGAGAGAGRLLAGLLAAVGTLIQVPYFCHRAARGARSWWGELVFAVWGYVGAAWLLGRLLPTALAAWALPALTLVQVLFLWWLARRIAPAEEDPDAEGEGGGGGGGGGPVQPSTETVSPS